MTDYLHKLRWTAPVLCLLGSLTANAYDFVVDGLAYNIISNSTVEITSTIKIEFIEESVVEYEPWGEPINLDYWWIIDGSKKERYDVPHGINYPYIDPTVIIPENVVNNGVRYSVVGISDFAFAFSNIESVSIPSSITNIGSAAFEQCDKLNMLNISDLESWCKLRFSGVLTHVVYESNEFWSHTTFYTTTSGNPTELTHHLFLNESELTSVAIPEGITTLCYTFIGCSNLSCVTIPNSVTKIGDYTFHNCSGLPSVTIPNTVTEIGKHAFHNCRSLASIIIPNSVAVVGDSAFSACSGLSGVHISDLAAWCNIGFHGLEANPLTCAHHLYLNNIEVTDLMIPDGIKEVKAYSFTNCSGLTKVTIPNSVLSIGPSSFYNCVNLTEVLLPATVTDFGTYTFAGAGITRLPLTEAMTKIPQGTFSYCQNLPDTVVIPPNITSIGGSAFAHSPIDCLFLPATIGQVEDGSFEATGLRDVFLSAFYPPCHINSGGNEHYYWSAFDDVTYSDAILHIPPGAKANYSLEFENDYVYEWTWFEHIEEYGVPLTAIAFDQQELTVAEATSAELTVLFSPTEWVDKRLRLTSSNPAVANADSIGLGKIRVNALDSGRAVITATTTDGTNLVASCVVTVTEQGIAAIELNVDSAMLNIGEQLQLIATEHPSGLTATDVVWSSSNEAVATVTSSGKVTARSPGEATITAIMSDSLQATCVITVPVPTTTGISLSKSELNLPRGDEYQLTVTFKPAYAESPLKWISSDVQVVSVDNKGKIKALKEGLAVVSVTTTDGTNLTASCLVTVYERLLGDLNADGVVDIDDLNVIINIMLGKAEPSTLADIDSNGDVDIDDLNIIINIMLGRYCPIVTTYTVGSTSFRMVHIEGGTFTMGATIEQGSDAASIEKPAHQVALSSFGIGETEVTQALWSAVMGSNPSGFTSDGQLPVECVSYDDCQAFIIKLNELTGEQFRLPTEAEWEYAARGGSQSKGYKYAGSSDIAAVGWCSSNAGEATHPVAQKAANELGLYDMSGNVWEWCSDWYGPYDAVAQTNPTGPDSGTMHVCRGGGWHSAASSCRTASRTYNVPTKATNRIGLRLAINRF